MRKKNFSRSNVNSFLWKLFFLLSLFYLLLCLSFVPTKHTVHLFLSVFFFFFSKRKHLFHHRLCGHRTISRFAAFVSMAVKFIFIDRMQRFGWTVCVRCRTYHFALCVRQTKCSNELQTNGANAVRYAWVEYAVIKWRRKRKNTVEELTYEWRAKKKGRHDRLFSIV